MLKGWKWQNSGSSFLMWHCLSHSLWSDSQVLFSSFFLIEKTFDICQTQSIVLLLTLLKNMPQETESKREDKNPDKGEKVRYNAVVFQGIIADTCEVIGK